MSATLILPVAVALAAAALGGLSQRYRRPGIAAWSLVLSTVLAAAGAVSAALMTIVSFIHHAPVTGGIVSWCLGIQRSSVEAPWGEAALAATFLAIAGVRVRRCRRGYRRLAPDHPGDEVELVDRVRPLAYTLPGRWGRIVVSTGMLGALRSDEQAVLFAHERSHLRRRHDRFLYAVDLGVAVVPPLAPMRRFVRFATERWADEDAARAVGDRRLVARAIARAALAQGPTMQPGQALAELGVRTRVDQLLAAPSRPSAVRATLLLTGALTMTVVVGASVQVHHFAMVVEHLCGRS